MRTDTVRRFALALTLAALAWVPARATEYLTLDGTWWSTASNADKITVVEGIIAGMSDGYFSATIGALQYVPLNKWKQATSGLQKTEPSYSKTFGAYVSEVDAIYADPKATGIRVSRVMLCLRDNGSPDSCIQANEKAVQQ